MILIGLGANLPSIFGPPETTLETAKDVIDARDLRVVGASRVWRTAPVPVSDQPWYCNAVIRVETEMAPQTLLALLKRIESEFGRSEDVRNAPRVLDLDLLAYGDVVCAEGDLILPHPRMHERGFVLYPLAEIAPAWRHPVSRKTVSTLIENLPKAEKILPRTEAA